MISKDPDVAHARQALEFQLEWANARRGEHSSGNEFFAEFEQRYADLSNRARAAAPTVLGEWIVGDDAEKRLLAEHLADQLRLVELAPPLRARLDGCAAEIAEQKVGDPISAGAMRLRAEFDTLKRTVEEFENPVIAAERWRLREAARPYFMLKLPDRSDCDQALALIRDQLVIFRDSLWTASRLLGGMDVDRTHFNPKPRLREQIEREVSVSSGARSQVAGDLLRFCQMLDEYAAAAREIKNP